MSQVTVKWVDENDLFEFKQTIENIGGCKATPVVELSALREVVEGLKLLSMQQPHRSHLLWGEWVNGPDYRTKSFKQWLAQRLLARLGKVGT